MDQRVRWGKQVDDLQRMAIRSCLAMGVLLLFVLLGVASGARDFHLPTFFSESGKVKKVAAAARHETKTVALESAHICDSKTPMKPLDYSGMDAVIVMVAPVCTTYRVVQMLVLNFHFRSIYFVVKSSEYCPYLEGLHPSVICLDENEVLPGVTYKSLAARSQNLKKHQGISNRVGWYLQQYLKLGVALHIEGLSDHYLVWDADNIPTKPFELFTPSGATRFCANPVSHKSTGYMRFYEATTGMKLMKPGGYPKNPRDNSFNYVCGYMVMYRPYVREMLEFMGRYITKRHNLPTRDQGFPWNIHVVGNIAIEGNYFFSEYDSYGSWVQLKHPERHEVDFDVQYVRNPDAQVSNPSMSRGGGGKGKGGKGGRGGDTVAKFSCCLTHKRICKVSRNSTGDLVNILIWEEHKMRYRIQDQCTDPLPADLAAAVAAVGDGTNPDR